MTTAHITPLPSGSAVLEHDGLVQDFPNWVTASLEAEARGLRWCLDRFPPIRPAVFPPRS